LFADLANIDGGMIKQFQFGDCDGARILTGDLARGSYFLKMREN